MDKLIYQIRILLLGIWVSRSSKIQYKRPVEVQSKLVQVCSGNHNIFLFFETSADTGLINGILPSFIYAKHGATMSSKQYPVKNLEKSLSLLDDGYHENEAKFNCGNCIERVVSKYRIG
jgi:hypothetical protein